MLSARFEARSQAEVGAGMSGGREGGRVTSPRLGCGLLKVLTSPPTALSPLRSQLYKAFNTTLS